MTKATNIKNHLVTLCIAYFLKETVMFPIIEFVLSEENTTKLFQSNKNASFTSLHTSYICCAIEPMLIFGISSSDIAVSPES